MKNKTIRYLTAFLLSLSLIFLLEASSFRLLAEDIKPKEKKEVKIELLLSASENKNGKTGGNKEIKEKSVETKTEQLKTEKAAEEADKNSSAAAEQQINESKELEKVSKKNSQVSEKSKAEDKKKKNDRSPEKQKEKRSETKNEQSIETEKVEKKNNEPPVWLQKKEENKEGKQQKKEEKSSEFELDKFLEKIESENNSEKRRNNSSDKNKSTNLESKEDNRQESKNEAEQQNTVKNSSENSAAEEQNDSTKESENKIYDLRKGNSDNIKKPKVKDHTQPVYPDKLRKRDIEGKVILLAKINKNGEIKELKINKSSGFDLFDEAALKGVSNWKFKPAEKEEKKVGVIVKIPIQFKLN